VRGNAHFTETICKTLIPARAWAEPYPGSQHGGGIPPAGPKFPQPTASGTFAQVIEPQRGTCAPTAVMKTHVPLVNKASADAGNFELTGPRCTTIAGEYRTCMAPDMCADLRPDVR
jgi:hypothetical protein